jgi:hypothetical protein
MVCLPRPTRTGGFWGPLEPGDGSGRRCPPVEIGNTKGRKEDEILNTGGGTDEPNGFVPCGNVCVYRTDRILTKLKWFSAREIAIPPTPP